MASIYDISIQDIDGKPLATESLRGKAVLVVNVASRCGFTPQYAGLEKLHEELAGQGLVVLGVPSNDFGAQEPGTEAEIKGFCSTTYDVKFPMTQKVAVLGAGKHPLYAFLTGGGGEVKWNFEKFLVGKDGQVVGRFSSKVDPQSPELRQAIATALAG